MSDRFLEQRINIKFCINSGENAKDICTKLCDAYGGASVKKSSVFGWHKWFKKGCENEENYERIGRSKAHRIDGNGEN
jgi:hypothetical protein